jgi:hypothetical protein
MCLDCYKERGKPKIKNKKVNAAVDALVNLYEKHLVGGRLHIVTDDWNICDSSLDFCKNSQGTTHMNYEFGYFDELEKEAYEKLKVLTIQERASALAIFWGYK